MIRSTIVLALVAGSVWTVGAEKRWRLLATVGSLVCRRSRRQPQ